MLHKINLIFLALLNLQYFQKLFKESKWSRTLFGYQYLAFKFMADSESSDLEEIAQKVPRYQLKIGWKFLLLPHAMTSGNPLNFGI